MSGPRSLDSLHKMPHRDGSASESSDEFEAALDSLLSVQKDAAEAGDATRDAELQQSPLDRLRAIFSEDLVPLVCSMGQRYASKGVCVHMDASDFLAGGRGLQIEIRFRDNRLCLDGTVMPDSIAFHETRFTSDLGGTVVGGPMLRARHLTKKAFADFLYDRIIKLVKSVSR